MNRRTLPRLLAGAALASPLPAMAQAFPNQPVRMVVPLAAATLTDVIARFLAEPMARELGVPVIVENRAGANGALSAAYVKQQRPDGYAVLLAGVSLLAFNPFLYGNLPYDPARDFTYIAPVVNTGFMLVVSRRSGITSVAEFLARARARPGEITYGSAGNGNSTHLAMEMVTEAADIRLTHVPYSSTSPVTALLTGEIDSMLSTVGSVVAQVRAGTVVPLAVLLPRRLAELPEVPTLSEAGLEAPTMPGWYALIGPAGMPEEPVRRLNRAMQVALEDPGVLARLRDIHLEAIEGSPESMRAAFERDSEIWGAFIRRRNLRLS